VTLYHATAQRAIRPDWRRMLGYFPFVMSLGIGLAVNNTRAVVGALFGGRGVFHRTPKFSIERRGDAWRGKRYRAPGSLWALAEVALGLYFAWAMLALVEARLYAPLPFFLLYLFGFLYVGTLSLVHAARRA
jgi:hypothetical protein